MTITTNPARDEYTSSPGQTVFNYTFKIYASTDLNVYVTPEGQDADDAADISTDYTVDSNTIGDEAGGFITFNNPLADGDRVTISSDIPYDRTVDYQNNGDFRPDTVNSDNDRQVSQIKQIESGLSRTLQFPSSLQNATGVSMDSPESGKYVRWKSDLSGLENVELPAGQVAANGVVLIYPDVATMKASTDDNLIPGITVATQGYYTAGDGGGALYLIATPQAADEYGDHTLANSNVAVLQETVANPLQYGAHGDGVADDTDSVQAAEDSNKALFLRADKTFLLSGTLYLGPSRKYGWGTLLVKANATWAQRGSAFRASASGIITKSADGAGYGISSQKINIDGIKIVIEKTDAGACDHGLKLENIGSGTVLAEIRPTGSTQNNTHALDCYQNNHNMIIDGIYESGVLGQIDGLTSIRNVGAGTSSSSIQVRGVFITNARNEALAVYNVNGQVGTTMRNVTVGPAIIKGQSLAFAWINNTNEPADSFSGCTISNCTLISEDLQDGSAIYGDENVGAVAANVTCINRQSTAVGATSMFGFSSRLWDGDRPKAKWNNCTVQTDLAPTSDVFWGFTGDADLVNCETSGDFFKFSLRDVSGTVIGGIFEDGSTHCANGVGKIIGATLKGKVKDVRLGLDQVEFDIDAASNAGSDLISFQSNSLNGDKVGLNFNVTSSGTGALSRVVNMAPATGLNSSIWVNYQHSFDSGQGPTLSDSFVSAAAYLAEYEVVWSDGGTLTRQTKTLDI